MKVRHNGLCPHCGRADAVVERPNTLGGRGLRTFECRGCSARWAGVRDRVRHHRRAVA